MQIVNPGPASWRMCHLAQKSDMILLLKLVRIFQELVTDFFFPQLNEIFILLPSHILDSHFKGDILVAGIRQLNKLEFTSSTISNL